MEGRTVVARRIVGMWEDNGGVQAKRREEGMKSAKRTIQEAGTKTIWKIIGCNAIVNTESSRHVRAGGNRADTQ